MEYSDVDFVWVSNHYDIHLEGLCREDGKLCRFEIDYETEKVSIFNLTFIGKINWIAKKKIFEWCIGYHWSYPQYKQDLQFEYKNPEWLWKIIFKIYYKFS